MSSKESDEGKRKKVTIALSYQKTMRWKTVNEKVTKLGIESEVSCRPLQLEENLLEELELNTRDYLFSLVTVQSMEHLGKESKSHQN